jgi:hypothetical protein
MVNIEMDGDNSDYVELEAVLASIIKLNRVEGFEIYSDSIRTINAQF